MGFDLLAISWFKLISEEVEALASQPLRLSAPPYSWGRSYCSQVQKCKTIRN